MRAVLAMSISQSNKLAGLKRSCSVRSRLWVTRRFGADLAMSASRPEHTAPPDLFYNETEARKYHSSSRIVGIQAELAERAIELLNLPEGQRSFILDIGCGTCLSGEALELIVLAV